MVLYFVFLLFTYKTDFFLNFFVSLSELSLSHPGVSVAVFGQVNAGWDKAE